MWVKILHMRITPEPKKQERHPRLPANDRVMIQGLSTTSWTVNWSGSGFCLLSEEQIHEGQRVNVEFPDRYMRGEANVIWALDFADGCLAGLEFLSVERRAVSRA